MERSTTTTRLVTTLVASKVLLHLAIVSRYGYHGDELYFIECSKHLAWGYVDHPPIVPWLAWLAGAFDHSIIALRMPSILAGGATMYLTLRWVRDWRGGPWAIVFAGLGVLFAPAYLRMNSMLDIPAIELLLWTAASYLVTRILSGANPRWWLGVGAIAGLGLLTKHSMVLWGFGLVVGLIATDARKHLRTPWPWLGGALAILIVSPNLLWLAHHEWATFEFLGNMRRTLAAMIPRPLFLAGQVLYMHPLALPIWTFGLWSLFRAEDRPRVLGWIYVVPLATLLMTGGKPYYLAPAYPVLFAAGGVALARALQRRPRVRMAYLGVYLATGIGFALCVLPILNVQSIDRALDSMLGWAVPSQALTHDLHAEFGWTAHADAVREVVDALPEEERERTTLITSNYSSASALRFYAPDLPPATSGHLTYYLWGPEPGEIVIAWGMSERWLREHFEDVRRVGHIDAPLARPHDHDLPIYSCRRPRESVEERWLLLRNYDNSGAHPSVRTDTSALRDE